ncbi:MAG: tetratricopeptide repeat protein [Flavobacteriales bacterium]|nr:tetratricopeptide repeat protein [Flavobacteriales bacterium]
MKRFTILLLFISLWQATLAQSPIDFTQLVGKTHTERTLALFDYYEQFVRYQDSVAIFNDLQRVRELAEKHNDPDFALEADLIELHYYNYRSDDRLPELTEKALELIQKAREVNAIWLEARCESLIGTRLYDRGQYESGLLHIRNSVRLLEDKDPAEYPIKSICLTQLGHVHYDFREYDEAIRRYQQAVESMSVGYRHYYRMFALNMMGITYRRLGQLDSSNAWFQRVYDFALETKDTVYPILSKGNLGENYYLQGDIARAELLLLEDMKEAKRVNDLGRASNALTILADIALQTGRTKLATGYLTEALQHACSTGELTRKAFVYPIAAKLYGALGNAEMVKAYVDSSLLMKDGIEREYDRVMLARAEQKLELERIATQTAKLEGERKLQIQRRNVLIGLMVLVLTVLSVMFIRFRAKRNRQRALLVQEKEDAEHELKLAKQQLLEFVQEMETKNIPLGDVTENDSNLQQLQEAKILTDEDWARFKQLFENVHAGYIERLEAKYPNISEAEKRFILLTKMDVSAKQMTQILGVGDNTIRQTRSRLRRKLNIETVEELLELIARI